MVHQLEATPTEWRGVRYRSKCEAMFAVWLYNDELACNRELQNTGSQSQVGFDIQYEPQPLSIGRWCPDFFVKRAYCEPLQTEVRLIAHCSYHVIEYKPSQPTQTYAETFQSRCGELHKKFFSGQDICYSLYYGSPYEVNRSARFYWCWCSVPLGWRTEHNWLKPDFAQAVLNHRFDLK